MKKRFFAFALLFMLILAANNNAFSRPKRSKSCVRKVLLPGQSKAIKCTKARKIKNNYF